MIKTKNLRPEFYRRALIICSLGAILFSAINGISNIYRELWQDELLLAELTRPSFKDILQSSLQTANHSAPFLWYAKWMRLILGDGVVELRLISLLPSLIAALYCYKISRNCLKLPIDSSIFTLGVFVNLHIFHFGINHFRPYGGALLGMSASLYYCLRFRDTGRYFHVVLGSFFLSLAVYCQYVYVLFGVLSVFTLNSRVCNRKSLRAIFVFTVSLVVFLIPVFFHFLSLVGRSQSLSYAKGPNFRDVILYFSSSKYLFLTLAIQPGLLSTAFTDLRENLYLRISLLSLVLPVIVFWLLQITTDVSLWLDRYMFWSTIPFTFYFGQIISARKGFIQLFSAVVVISVLMAACPQAEKSHWRASHTAIMEELAKRPSSTIVSQTGFIEADNISFLRSKYYLNYFLSPLRFYGYFGHSRILPMDTATTERKEYLKDMISSLKEEKTREVILVTLPHDWADSGLQFAEQMLASGFSIVRLYQTSGIFVFVLSMAEKDS